LKKFNFIFFFISFIWVAHAQISCDTNFNLSCVNDSFLNRKLFIFGENHGHTEETVVHQLKLVRKLIDNNVDTIVIVIEAPPVVAFIISEYFKGSINVCNDRVIQANFKPFIDSLTTYRDDIEFKFFGVDINYNHYFDLTSDFFLNLDSIAFADLSKIKSKRRFINRLKCISEDSIFNYNLKKQIPQDEFAVYKEEVKSLLSYGFINAYKAEKYLILRDERFALYLDSLYEKNECILFTVGIGHIRPDEGSSDARLLKNLTKFKRSDILLMPILYRYFEYKLRIYNSWVSEREKMIELIEKGIFDVILR